MTQELGMPDLVLITGDITNRGIADQFELADRLLEALLGWLRAEAPGDPDPLVVPVPGNHDLLRPNDEDAYRYLVLNCMPHAGDVPAVRAVRDRMFHETAPSAEFVAPLFSEYTAWFHRSIAPQFAGRGQLTASYFPGDISVEVRPEGAFSLGIVGLNTTWVQFQAGDYLGKLWVEPEQLHHALPSSGTDSPLSTLRRWDRVLLLTHQPPDWLHQETRARFDEEVDAVVNHLPTFNGGFSDEGCEV